MNEHDVVHDGDERIYHHAEQHDVHDLAAGGPVRPEVVEESGFFLEILIFWMKMTEVHL